MHHHLEIILPPVEDVTGAVAKIMKPFDENPDAAEAERPSTSNSFWDWYVIGGRWAGTKLECALDLERKNAFFDELTKRGVMVSGFQAGKQEISPSSQIPIVDALWNDFFPDAPVKVCPFFNHFNDQYRDSKGYPDVMTLRDCPRELKAEHVIIAGPSWRGEGSLEAKYMVQQEMWNSVCFVETTFDGYVSSAVLEHVRKLGNYKSDYAAKYTPQDDWLVVTVDYHT